MSPNNNPLPTTYTLCFWSVQVIEAKHTQQASVKSNTDIFDHTDFCSLQESVVSKEHIAQTSKDPDRHHQVIASERITIQLPRPKIDPGCQRIVLCCKDGKIVLTRTVRLYINGVSSS